LLEDGHSREEIRSFLKHQKKIAEEKVFQSFPVLRERGKGRVVGKEEKDGDGTEKGANEERVENAKALVRNPVRRTQGGGGDR